MNHFVFHELSALKGFDPSTRGCAPRSGSTLSLVEGFDATRNGPYSGLVLSTSAPYRSLSALSERCESKGEVLNTESRFDLAHRDPEPVEGSKPDRTDLPFCQAHYSRN